jgi:hypothetical protein
MGRVRDGKVVLDVRTVFAEQESLLVAALRQALGTPSCPITCSPA